jgi:hypothetical protein
VLNLQAKLFESRCVGHVVGKFSSGCYAVLRCAQISGAASKYGGLIRHGVRRLVIRGISASGAPNPYFLSGNLSAYTY